MGRSRREFLKEAAGFAAAMACPCLFAANPPPKKPVSYSLIAVTAKVCGTCQHWKGERMVIDKGKRVKCQQFAIGPCFRGAGFKYSATSPAASHGCIAGGQYKPWVGLP